MYDVYLVFSDSNLDLVKLCKKYLKQAKSKIRVISLGDIQTKPDTWQHDVYSAMVACARYDISSRIS